MLDPTHLSTLCEMLPVTGPRQHLNPWTVHCFSEGDIGHTAPHPERVLICHRVSVKASHPQPLPLSLVPVNGCLSLFFQPAQPGSHSTVNWGFHSGTFLGQFCHLLHSLCHSFVSAVTLPPCFSFSSILKVSDHLQNSLGSHSSFGFRLLFLCPQALAFPGCLKTAGPHHFLPQFFGSSRAIVTSCVTFSPMTIGGQLEKNDLSAVYHCTLRQLGASMQQQVV